MFTLLAVEVLIGATQQLRAPNALSRVRDPTAPIKAFTEARQRIDREEAPAIRQRSRVRYFQRHLDRLRVDWQEGEPKSATGP